MKITILFLLLFLTACTTVRFNERERLAEWDMIFDPDPLQVQITGHVYSPRQGAAGGFSTSGGGGCGCY